MFETSAKHALIIEDELIVAMEVEDLLREVGFTSFDIAATPDHALEQATRHRPGLITADVRIVGGTGIQAVRAITERLGEIPYFYVTGNVEMLAGQDDAVVVEKPINPRYFRRACADAGSRC